MRYFEKLIGETEDGLMVKEVLRPLGAGRKLRHRLLEQQLIQVNGSPAYLTGRVHTGDIITVDAPIEETSILLPENLPFDVAFEDEHMLIVNKPANMLVHPTAKERTGTLANAVLFYLRMRGEKYPFRPLHRLDRDTSGLLIIAKHKLALERLEKALKRREITREYIAFVSGEITEEYRIVNAPIGLLPDQTIKRGVVTDGRQAVTHVSVLQLFSNEQACKVKLKLETGRTHQIRVHLAYIGHPVLGDRLYGCKDEWGLTRQALHAARLSFEHPFTHVTTTIESQLPDDLKQLEMTLLSI